MAAYLMLVLGGNASPTAADVTKALETVGVAVDSARLDALIKEMAGKELSEILEEGTSLLAKFGGGGGGGGGGAAAGGDAAAPAEKEPEVEEEMDMGGSMDMFGGDEGEGGGDY